MPAAAAQKVKHVAGAAPDFYHAHPKSCIALHQAPGDRVAAHKPEVPILSLIVHIKILVAILFSDTGIFGKKRQDVIARGILPSAAGAAWHLVYGK